MAVPLPATHVRRPDWPQQAIVSGFIATAAATFVLAIVYAADRAGVNTDGGANTIQHWLYGLAHNTLTARATDGLYGALLFNVALGLLWAGIYAYYVEPALSGPGWRKGLLFSLVPWLLSILIFFPLVGAGILGFGLNAGPLPIIGNLVLHAVFGVVLGRIYALSALGGTDANGIELGRNNSAERGAALGILSGAIVGGIVGLGMGIVTGSGPHADGLGSITTGPWEIALFGAILGAACAALLGSMIGLNDISKAQGHRPDGR